MKVKLVFVTLIVFLVTVSAMVEPYQFFIKPEGWPKPVYNFSGNMLTQEKINLGRVLFYDPVLSEDSSISCASCHNSYTAFTHVDHALSHGIHNRIGKRNAPALMNLAWSTSFMWDGSIRQLDRQALAPLQDSNEMNESLSHILIKLNRSAFYRKYFYMAYGDSIITTEPLLKSIAQFLVTLVSANSKYDQMVRKQIEFSAQEKNGYLLFKKHCNVCHTEPLFTNFKFKSNGLLVDTILKDAGRMRITLQSKDSLLFKVPSLRNIEYSFPYMHDGRYKKLFEVVQHYINLNTEMPQLSDELKQSIKLTANEKVDLVAFLLTLSDKEFNFNSNTNYPRLLMQKH